MLVEIHETHIELIINNEYDIEKIIDEIRNKFKCDMVIIGRVVLIQSRDLYKLLYYITNEFCEIIERIF